MWQEILNIVISNGIFATLFVLLLAYLLKDSSKREQKYSDTIKNLSDNLDKALNLENESEEIKEQISKTSEKLDKNTHIIKRVKSDVKSVKKDVKEIKQILTPKDKKNEKI